MQSISDFQMEGKMMRYSLFVPRLYNFCISLGFTPGKIMPSRAFCSDENQGFPIILITKHFGTFPFNHGRVGGIVATDRHGPYANHGQDLVIVQASHVGYDPETRTFGQYARMQTTQNGSTSDCGKIADVISWYENEYSFARENINIERSDNVFLLTIDNKLLDEERSEGLFLNLESLLAVTDEGHYESVRSLSTSKVFKCGKDFAKVLEGSKIHFSQKKSIADLLNPDLFYFRRKVEKQDHLLRNLFRFMPEIVSSPAPSLYAAQLNTQVEFDRTFRTIVQDEAYKYKHILFIAGVNIDISPDKGQIFPLTKFVPWAAFVQNQNNTHYVLEQNELIEHFNKQSAENPDQIDMEGVIFKMAEEEEVQVIFD
jgi:hypothetical protein